MRIERLASPPGAALLADARAVIEAGGTLVFPTDTVYGIGCDPENRAAVAAVFAAKSRPPDKPLAIHVAVPADAWQFAQDPGAAARALVTALWPGPLALVVRRAATRGGPAALDGPTISLRCPDDATCAAILRVTGPLAATSANISGATAFAGGDDLRALPRCDLALIAGPTLHRRESTVLDCTSTVVRVLRDGAMPRDRIQAVVAAAGCTLHP